MGHYQSSYKAGTYSPAGSPYILLAVFPAQEFYIKSFGKVLSQKVRCSGLKSFAVLHQCFDTVVIFSSRKSLARCFYTTDSRQSHKFLCESCINLQHFFSSFNCFFRCGVSGMPPLPQEFCSSEK